MAQELDIAFLTVGFDPKWAVKDVPIMPKNRYRSALASSGLNFVDSSCMVDCKLVLADPSILSHLSSPVGNSLTAVSQGRVIGKL